MLAEKGHEVAVFVYDNSVKNTTITIEAENIRIIRFSPHRTGACESLGFSTHISYEYAAIVKEFIEKEGKPDIIESQEYLGIAYFLLLFKWLEYEWCKNVPVVITAHSPAFIYLPYNQVSIYKYPIWWISEMERFCLRAADHIISPTQFMIMEIAKDIELSPRLYSVIPNPYEAGNISTVSGTEVSPVQKEIVLLGKLSAQKGTFRLLQYMQAEVWQNHPDLVLRLIGDPGIVYHPDKKTMGQLVKQQYAVQLQTGQLVMEDKIHSSQYAEKLRQAIVVVVPSTVDNLPYVVIEMMAMGKIVLASVQGGQAEIIDDGEDGFLFDHNRPSDFSNQLNRILKLSDTERRRISGNAINKIRNHYAPAHIYDQKIEVLRQLKVRTITEDSFPFIRVKSRLSEQAGTRTGPLLSVVITFYNSGKYLQGVLANVSASDIEDFEVLIIDDGSDDPESITQLNDLPVSDRLRVVRQKNQGLAASRNTGAREAKGKYIAFLDADDLVAPGYYSKTIRVLERYDNVHFAGAWTRYFEGSGKVWPTFNPEPPTILYHNMINSAALVFRRSSFQEAGGNDTSMVFPGLEDYDMIVKMAEADMGGVSIPEILFQYRVRNDSMVRAISTEKKKQIAENIRSRHSSIYSKYSVAVLNLTEMNGPAHLLDNPTLDYDFADKLPIGGRWSLKLASYIKRNRFIRPIAYKVYRIFN